MRRGLKRLMDGYAVGVSAWAAAWQLFHDRWGALALFNAWAFWLLVTGMPVAAARLWQRSRWLAGLWAGLGIWMLAKRYRHAFLWRKSGSGIPPDHQGPGTFSVLSFNVLKKNTQRDQIMDLITRHSPDIVLLQELGLQVHSQLKEGLEALYPHRAWRPFAEVPGGFGVFSRVPFEVTGLWALPGTRPYALRATFQLPQGPVDLYNLHLLPVGPNAVRKTGITRNFRLREQQVSILLQETGDRRCPALLLGDCNMSEGNDAYRLMISRLGDAWQQAGSGPGWTWPRTLEPFNGGHTPFMPMLRLDYCFCTPDVRPEAVNVIYEWTGSDHCPLLVRALI